MTNSLYTFQGLKQLILKVYLKIQGMSLYTILSTTKALMYSLNSLSLSKENVSGNPPFSMYFNKKGLIFVSYLNSFTLFIFRYSLKVNVLRLNSKILPANVSFVFFLINKDSEPDIINLSFGYKS